MKNLKEMLLQEQNRLERILQKSMDQLKNVPPGSLHLSRCNNTVQYYQSITDKRKNERYIAKENQQLVGQLAQKAYDEKICKLVKRRLSQIKRITKDYEDDEIERVFLNEHYERQKLIQPVEKTWEQQVKEWISESYTGKEFQEGTQVILTERKERVRSKSEKILADYFNRQGIPYKYERPLYLKGAGMVHPDFTFLSRKTGKEIYWEHNGRMGDPEYAQNAVRKIQIYEENGIYPGESLILTFETSKMVLDMKLVEKLVRRYLQ